MNKTVFTGNLGRDPEVRVTQSGNTVAELSLAVSDGYGDKKKTYWPRLVAFGKTAETIGNTLSKGRKILAECHYVQDNYEKDGQKKQVSRFIIDSFEYLDRKQEEKPVECGGLGKEVFPEESIPF